MSISLAEEITPSRFHDKASGVYLGPQRIKQEQAAGCWPDRVLTDFFNETVKQAPRNPAVLAYRTDSGSDITLSYQELSDRVDRIAANLNRLGVQKEDVVSFQLPNWWEFIAIHLACVRLGAVSNPLMPIFRARELEFMLEHAESRVLIVPKTFRKFDHASLADELQHRLPKLQHVLVIGGEDDNSFAAELLGEPGQGFEFKGTRMQPNDTMMLMYTSGTTGEPKGVMHTSNTMISSIGSVIRRLNLDTHDVLFMPSPFAHSIGFCYGMMMAIVLGRPLVTMDVWIPEQAADLIERHCVTYTFGATPFLADLVDVVDKKKPDLESFRLFMTAGAPVPLPLIASARDTLQASVICGWGMTEMGLVTSTLPSMQQCGLGSDGISIPGNEVRVVGSDLKEVNRGEEGNLQCRGSSTFIGYFKRPDLYVVDAEGWFDTGDLARMDEQGYISIVGRSKDIIIRGGENIPVVEVEKLIYEMPQISDVALVGMPDPRLGEKGCAFVTLHPGQSLSLEELTVFLDHNDLARQYMPERLEILKDMPRTPAGKVQKFVLRQRASDLTV